jgi:phage gp36-like protein
MPYALRADIEARIPPAHLTEALDDNGDGLEDVGLFAKIAAGVDSEIDGALSQRYALPLASAPAFLRAGACVLTCETLFQRRGIPADQNPFTAAAGKFRAKLEDIASGKSPLEVGTPPARPPISIITEPAGTVPRSRLNG